MENFDRAGKQWLIGAFEKWLALDSGIGVVFLRHCSYQ
jgi:hypothetical protein